MIADIITSAASDRGTQWYQQYHHYLLHGAFGAVLVSLLMAYFAQHRGRVLLLSLLTFHLHLLCDLVGSRGPAPEDLWPIFYFGPFSKDPMWLWRGQWRLDGWQNYAITIPLLIYSLCLGLRIGHTFVGVFNRWADAIFVKVLRGWRDNVSGAIRGK